jgi:CO/xanthine dehydrogenase Mo-binding subunit/aerobic-type carbon monoxide dehydrogenase small subunit (CoxS/CutS family)
MKTPVETRRIAITVNGERRELDLDPNRSLLDVLRMDLDLTGAKQGCDDGECGSCAVLLGQRTVMSCLLPVSRVGTKPVLTIEGLAASCRLSGAGEGDLADLHPLQQAFVDFGATQCGFCIPGMIMEAHALISAKPEPTREDIVNRLSRNLCRCTGYVKIVDAVVDAANAVRKGEWSRPREEVEEAAGARVPKRDSVDQVSGRARYAADLKVPGMLYAKVLRSPHHHARIVRIETSAAAALPGVEAVVTAVDIPARNTMLNARPQTFLFPKDKVRFRGEAVAAVAAVSEEIAEAAVGRIQVEYEIRPALLDPLEAMSDTAPQIHEPFANWVQAAAVTRGDVDRAFAEADVIVESTYQTAPREHAPMEPEAGLAYFDEGDRLVVHAPHHHPFAGQVWLAEMLGIERDRVRVICPAMGGNFGHRGDFLHDGVIALLALKTRKPVRIVYTRAESLLGSCKAHSYHLRYKTAATRDGKLTAVQAQIIGDGGCWIPHPEATTKPSSIKWLGEFAPGPYAVPNAAVTVYEVCTNRPRSNPMRGTHIPDLAFAWESQMDTLAARLRMDPLEFRLRNVIDEGGVTATGQVLDESVGARATLEAVRPAYAAARARARSEPPARPWHRGVGLACIWQVNGGGRGEEAGGGWHGLKFGPAKAAVELTDDGRIRVLCGVVEKGQGISIALAQIAAGALGVSLDTVDMVYGDTFLAPYPVGTSGQRTMFHVGGAIERACTALKAELVRAGAALLGVDATAVDIRGAWVTGRSEPTRRVAVADVARQMRATGRPRRYEGTFVFEKSARGQGPVYGYSTQVVELDVNGATGDVRVQQVTYAADLGKLINPQTWEGQVEGGVMMGLGYALRERFVPGETRTLKQYGLLGIRDAPPRVVSLVVEDPVTGGPFGAKGGAEMTASAGLAAVANAIADATGARVTAMPATSAAVLQAMDSAPAPSDASRRRA